MVPKPLMKKKKRKGNHVKLTTGPTTRRDPKMKYTDNPLEFFDGRQDLNGNDDRSTPHIAPHG